MNYLVEVFVFIFGAIVGSFLNVVILRYGNGIFKKKRSECFNCGQTLKISHLVPILSFVFLGGKCGFCKSKISIQYPLVEFTTALSYLLIFLKLGFSYSTLFYWIVWSLLIVIFVYDLKHKIIPDLIVYVLIVLSFLKVLYLILLSLEPNIIWLVLSGPIAALPLFLLWLISYGRWMGFGDVKLILSIGWLLGLSASFSALVLAFWIGALVGLFLLSIKFRNFKIKSEIPFAPFIIIGTALVWGVGIDVLKILN